MRNYFDALRIERQASPGSVSRAIDTLSPEALHEEGDLPLILNNEKYAAHYRRLHLQYEAIAATLKSTGIDIDDSGNQWSKRVVEFDVEQDTIER